MSSLYVGGFVNNKNRGNVDIDTRYDHLKIIIDLS